jgi:histidyl-tRNA synthetase
MAPDEHSMPRELRWPLTIRRRLWLRRQGRADGRLAIMPRRGETPTSESIIMLASAAKAQHAIGVTRELGYVEVEIAKVGEQICALNQRVIAYEQEVVGWPDAAAFLLPDEPRAVRAEPELIRVLLTAKARAEVLEKKSSVETALQHARDQRDRLTEQVAALRGTLKSINDLSDAVTEAIDSAANRQLSYYEMTLYRAHKHKGELRELLPLTRIGGN